MSYTSNKSHRKGTEYSVIYNDMRGVDFSLDGSGISKKRFSYLENMYRDYDGIGSGIVESIPGFRKVYSLKEGINGIFHYKTKSGAQRLVAHTKTKLFELDISDPDNTTSVATVEGINNVKSNAFFAKEALFVIDGNNFFKFSESSREILNEESTDIYIPTTYYNGTEYEQRNLLTRSFYEIYNLGSCDDLSHGTDNISYRITDYEKGECAITGYSGNSVNIYIPSRVLIGDRYYLVKRIDDFAFKDNANINNCIIASGVSYIGAMAFANCYALQKMILPDTVTEIGNACFTSCQRLAELHFGQGLTKIGDAIINTCTNLEEISYAGSASEFARIENTSTLGTTTIIYNRKIRSLNISVKVNSPATEIKNVTVDGEPLPFRVMMKNGLCDKVVITLDDKALYQGRDLKIFGTLSSEPADYKSVHRGFTASNFTEGKSVSSAIFGCRIAESFDGRIFLTGNPDYPGFCFYSSIDSAGENNPLYFGDMNYFKDGVGSFGNIGLLAAGDSLAVFKENDDGGGSIYYHTPHDTGIDILPRIYPVSYIHSGICAKGASISFFDDPVFVSEKGISALSKKTINLDRSIAVRSTNVNPKLLCEELSSLKLAVWRGYLAVLAGERMYLADSRALFESEVGDIEYEWYFLSGIGSYTNDSRVYRYASTSHTGYSIHPKTDTVSYGTVYSVGTGSELIYYVINGGIKYEVYPTEELRGGKFNPATDILAIGNLLFVATSNGDILLFNSDKRGVAPPTLTADSDFDAEEYKKIYGTRIHPYYYSFAGHAPRYALQTKKDNCSIPHLEKSTVKGSLSVKCRAVSSGKLICEVGCDNVGYREVCAFPSSGLSFSDIDFANLTLTTDDVYTVPIGEKAKGWIEKQISLYTEEYGSPFGIYTIAYRFSVKGKIKKSR